MSAHEHTADPHVLNGPAHGSHGSQRTYVLGFVLSIILTAIPFWLVMSGALGSKQGIAIAVVGFAFVQILVHMVCFLHMDTRSEGGWTMMALMFTVVVIAISLSGTLWVMYHLTDNMMPMSAHDMSQMP